MKQFNVATALITPTCEEGWRDINYGAFEALVNHNLDGGIDALVVAGWTGQSFALTPDERVDLFLKANEQAQAYGAQVIPGTGLPSTKATIELTKMLEQAGAETVLIISPCGNKPLQYGMEQHYITIAEHTDVNILLYSVPGRTGGTGILPHTCRTLSGIDNIVGIKESSGDLERVRAIIELTKSYDFDVYAGDDKYAVPIIEMGGTGLVSVASQIARGLTVQMVESAKDGDFDGARCISNILRPLHEVLFENTNPIPAHYALQLIGIEAGVPRQPLESLTHVDEERIRNTLRELNIIG